MDINYLDIALLIFLLGFGVVGFIVGFTEKVFSIISWISSAFLSYYTYDWVLPWISKWVEKRAIASLVTSIGLFIIYLSIFSLLSKAIHERIEKSMFKKADRYLGVLLGLATGYLVLALGALIGRAVVPSNQYPAYTKDSIIWSSAEKGSDVIESFLPLRKPTTTFLPTDKISFTPSSRGIKKPSPKKETHDKKSTTRIQPYSPNDRKEMSSLIKEYT